MLTDGYFLNYSRNGIEGQDDPWIKIDEHERWLRRGNNAELLGVPEYTREKFGDYKVEIDRDELLKMVLKEAPIIRMRGHKTYFTFEFNSSKINDALWTIFEFMGYAGGTATGMYVVNFATGEKIQAYYDKFRQYMDEDRAETLFRKGKEIGESTYKSLPESSFRRIFPDTMVKDIILK